MEKRKLVAIVAIFIGIILIGGSIINFSGNSDEQDNEFCLTSKPVYQLDCKINNKTVSVKANEKNVDAAIEKNNCSVTGRNDKLDIIYCNQETNLTKYKISTNPYSE